MVIRDLINELQKYPLDMQVLGRGYESGYNDIASVSLLSVHHVPDNPWYDGKYQAKYTWDECKDYNYTECLVLV